MPKSAGGGQRGDPRRGSPLCGRLPPPAASRTAIAPAMNEPRPYGGFWGCRVCIYRVVDAGGGTSRTPSPTGLVRVLHGARIRQRTNARHEKPVVITVPDVPQIQYKTPPLGGVFTFSPRPYWRTKMPPVGAAFLFIRGVSQKPRLFSRRTYRPPQGFFTRPFSAASSPCRNTALGRPRSCAPSQGL